MALPALAAGSPDRDDPAMRRFVALALLVGCGSSQSSEEKLVPPDDHKLHGGVETKADAMRIRYAGKAVPVESIPGFAEGVGLPVAGTADVDIDVTVPIAKGERDYRRATGTIDVKCTKCTLGGEGAKLKPRTTSKRAEAFAGDGINFGTIVFDRLEARIEIKNERAEIVRWVVESPDVTLKITGTAELASPLDQTQVHGCLQFAGKPDLQQRQPTTASLLALTGAPLGENGLYHIEVQGTIGAPKRFGRTCGEQAKPAAPAEPAKPELTKP